LEKHRVKSDDDYLFIKEDVPNKYLNTLDEADRKLNSPGLMVSDRELAKTIGKETKKGDWQYIRSHNMRKYFISALLNGGADIFFTDFLMGHKIDSTRAAYFRADPEKLKKRYLKYLPFLTIEDTQIRVVESEEYHKLKEENKNIKKQLDEINSLLTGVMKQQNESLMGGGNLIDELYDRDPELLKSRFGIDEEEYQRLKDAKSIELHGMTVKEYYKYQAQKKKEFFENLSKDEMEEIFGVPLR